MLTLQFKNITSYQKEKMLFYEIWYNITTFETKLRLWGFQIKEKKTIKNSTTFENIKLKNDFDFLYAINNLSDEFFT